MSYDGFSSQDLPQSPVWQKNGSSQPLRFVILWHTMPSLPEHNHRGSHFDLMLEQSGQLITFELQALPYPGELMPVLRLPNHRLDYLDYEGPISDNRGHVTRWTGGNYHTIRQNSQKWILELTTDRLNARIVLLSPAISDDETQAISSEQAIAEAASHPNRWHLRAPRWDVSKK